MRCIELFCGTKSFSKVAEKLGHQCVTIDNNFEFNPTYVQDVENIGRLERYDILWASPPCQSFSVAAISKNWYALGIVKSKKAEQALLLLAHTCYLIKVSQPGIWFIENPRGMMRKVIEPLLKANGLSFVRHTVSYCQYGDTRQKPTDIWTNCFIWKSRPLCKRGAPCHERAPRGSPTGTQGLKGAAARGVIPPALFFEIFESIQGGLDNERK